MAVFSKILKIKLIRRRKDDFVAHVTVSSGYNDGIFHEVKYKSNTKENDDIKIEKYSVKI